MTAQVFFSTWFVYQISRWIYYRKGQYSNKEEFIVSWFDTYPLLNKITIYGSGISAVVFTLCLHFKSIIVLAIIGSISVLYPIPILKPFGIETRLRDFPFVKIFLIALVWSSTAVILPYTEMLRYNVPSDIFYITAILFSAQFIYILFITLPFDINDAETDTQTNIKTIPTTLGIHSSKYLALLLGILHFILLYFFYKNAPASSSLTLSTLFLIGILLILLQVYTFTKSDKVPKWWIKIIYDGSMILYFLIVFLTNLR
ncbi:MAG: UbiA family prenyltransferase [Bacteroidetes bacterium]|nr:UbiA family prenyltransferase [Bacteroidota bacterium]